MRQHTNDKTDQEPFPHFADLLNPRFRQDRNLERQDMVRAAIWGSGWIEKAEI
jgi:hypothetical protein